MHEIGIGRVERVDGSVGPVPSRSDHGMERNHGRVRRCNARLFHCGTRHMVLGGVAAATMKKQSQKLWRFSAARDRAPRRAAPPG